MSLLRFGTRPLLRFGLPGLILVLSFALAWGQGQQVRFLSPKEGEILRGEVQLVVEGIGFRDLEILGVAHFEYSPDGQTYQLIASDNRSFDGFQVIWDTCRVPDGWYFLRATIVDLWNQRASAQIRVAVDNAGRLPLRLRVPQDFPTIEAALAQARAGTIIQVDATTGPYPPFTVGTSRVIVESVNGRAHIPAWEYGELIAVRVRGERVELRGFHLEGEIALEIEGQGHVVRENSLEGLTGLVVRGRGHVIEHNVLLGLERVDSLGVLLTGAEGNLLRQNEISDYEVGALVLSPGNHWEGNTFDDVGGIAILAPSNTIRGNTFLRMRNGPSILLLSSNNEVVGNLFADNSVGVKVLSSENLIKGNTFSGNEVGLGLAGGSSKNTIVENEFLGNGTGLEVAGDYEGWLLAPVRENTIQRNNFIGNRIGLDNMSPWVVDALENYWGSPTGPYHPEENPDGLGDKVSDNVVFKPWLKEPVVRR